MRYVLCALLLMWGGVAHAEEYRLEIAPTVMERLNALVSQGENHYYACLTGVLERQGEHLRGVVTGIYEPPQVNLAEKVIPLDACPINPRGTTPNTIATWHAHQRSICALSGTGGGRPAGGDVLYSLQRPWFEFMVVQTDQNRWCYLHREQIVELLRENKKVGRELKNIPFLAPPDDQQIRGRPN